MTRSDLVHAASLLLAGGGYANYMDPISVAVGDAEKLLAEVDRRWEDRPKTAVPRPPPTRVPGPGVRR